MSHISVKHKFVPNKKNLNLNLHYFITATCPNTVAKCLLIEGHLVVVIFFVLLQGLYITRFFKNELNRTCI